MSVGDRTFYNLAAVGGDKNDTMFLGVVNFCGIQGGAIIVVLDYS